MNNAALIAKIEKAWGHVAYPGDDNIFTPHSYDDEGIRDYFAGTTWRGHSVVSLRAHCSAISGFFTPVAYVYWLPAYLIALLEAPDDLSQGVDSMVFSLLSDHWMAPADKSEYNARMSLLSREQITVIADVFENYLQRVFDPGLPELTKDERAVVENFRAMATRGCF